MSSLSKSPTVLLVEDSEDDAFFFSRALRLAGSTQAPVHITDGGATIAYLSKVLLGAAPAPDLIFLDLKIPTRSGFEVLEWMRGQTFNPPLDVAVLSGSEQRSDVERAMALGATAYYVKPVLVQQLKTRLSAWQGKSSEIPMPESVAATAGPPRSA